MKPIKEKKYFNLRLVFFNIGGYNVSFIPTLFKKIILILL